MQHALRPYATAGVALVGASIIAVTPMVAAPALPRRPACGRCQLVDAWSDLLTDTTANLDSIVSNANYRRTSRSVLQRAPRPTRSA